MKKAILRVDIFYLRILLFNIIVMYQLVYLTELDQCKLELTTTESKLQTMQDIVNERVGNFFLYIRGLEKCVLRV